MPDARRAQAQLLLGIVRLLHARQRANPQAVAVEAQRAASHGGGAGDGAVRHGPGPARALALVSFGSTEVWTTRVKEAERHLEQGVALARRIGRPSGCPAAARAG